MISSLKIECIQLICFVMHERWYMKLFQVPKLQNCMCLSESVIIRAEKFLWQTHLFLVVLVTEASLVNFESPAWARLTSQATARHIGTGFSKALWWTSLYTKWMFTANINNGTAPKTQLCETPVLHAHLLTIECVCVWLQPQGRSRLVGDCPQPSAAGAEPNRRHDRALVPQAFPCPTHKILAVNSLYAIH